MANNGWPHHVIIDIHVLAYGMAHMNACNPEIVRPSHITSQSTLQDKKHTITCFFNGVLSGNMAALSNAIDM